MQTRGGILIKTCSETMHRIYTRVPAGDHLYFNKFNASSFHYTTDCAALFSHHWLRCLVFTYLTAKEYYRLFEFLNDALVHMQPEVINIGTSEMKEYYRLFEFLNDTLVHMQQKVLNIVAFKIFKTKFRNF